MKATVVGCVMGVFGFGEANELVDVVFFPKDPRETAEILQEMEAGRIIDELTILINNLRKKGYANFIFENPGMAGRAREGLNIDVDVISPSKAGGLLRGNLEKFAVEVGFVEEPMEIRNWVHRVSMELAQIGVKEASEKRDLVVAQAIQTVDDLDKTLNLFASRAREWYGLHFPELDRLVEKHETYLRLVANLGRRENFTSENLESEGLPEAKAKEIAEVGQASMGAELAEEDLDQIQIMCRNTMELNKARHSLEGYVDSIMEEVAPNIRALAGPLLGARLIALAGGLNNMAKKSASTIQVLGAEKALFRALRSGATPPKHGIIFQHPLLHDAKRWQRGKVARALAGKLAIAARIDAFSGTYAGDDLKRDLGRRFEEIQEKYKRPTPAKPPAKRQPRRRKRVRKS